MRSYLSAVMTYALSIFSVLMIPNCFYPAGGQLELGRQRKSYMGPIIPQFSVVNISIVFNMWNYSLSSNAIRLVVYLKKHLVVLVGWLIHLNVTFINYFTIFSQITEYTVHFEGWNITERGFIWTELHFLQNLRTFAAQQYVKYSILTP